MLFERKKITKFED